MKKLWDLKKGFSNLELERQGGEIIMGVTGLLLLGQFYTIQTQRPKRTKHFEGKCMLPIPLNELLWLQEHFCTKKVFFHIFEISVNTPCIYLVCIWYILHNENTKNLCTIYFKFYLNLLLFSSFYPFLIIIFFFYTYLISTFCVNFQEDCRKLDFLLWL